MSKSKRKKDGGLDHNYAKRRNIESAFRGVKKSPARWIQNYILKSFYPIYKTKKNQDVVSIMDDTHVKIRTNYINEEMATKLIQHGWYVCFFSAEHYPTAFIILKRKTQ